jgi:lipoate-protein ligase A
MDRWRLIDTGLGSPEWNMAVDEAILYGFQKNDLPILRLYRWKPSLSFGRFSKPAESVDLPLLKAYGIPYVRRITGGGVLVHGGDLSYALILPRTLAKERGVKESYRRLCGFLLRLYEALGCRAGFACESQIRQKRSNICLAGNEAYDIVIGGRKIGGNAQRHIRKAMLQHGSIPIRMEKEFFEPLFLEESGLKRAATLRELGIDVGYEALARLLVETFRETYDVDLVTGGLDRHEACRARELLERKYGTQKWNIYAA